MVQNSILSTFRDLNPLTDTGRKNPISILRYHLFRSEILADIKEICTRQLLKFNQSIDHSLSGFRTMRGYHEGLNQN